MYWRPTQLDAARAPDRREHSHTDAARPVPQRAACKPGDLELSEDASAGRRNGGARQILPGGSGGRQLGGPGPCENCLLAVRFAAISPMAFSCLAFMLGA